LSPAVDILLSCFAVLDPCQPRARHARDIRGSTINHCQLPSLKTDVRIRVCRGHQGVPDVFEAGRYHSLYGNRSPDKWPSCLVCPFQLIKNVSVCWLILPTRVPRVPQKCTAETDDGVCMALQHESYPMVSLSLSIRWLTVTDSPCGAACAGRRAVSPGVHYDTTQLCHSPNHERYDQAYSTVKTQPQA